MREIKFRGYNFDKGWVYGSLIQKHKPTEVENVYWCSLIHNGALDAELVVTESVGQYTGLKDKNGKEIYEGDIVIPSFEAYYEVIWEGACWKIRACNGNQKPATLRGKRIRVIGNIYENAELLTNDKARVSS